MNDLSTFIDVVQEYKLVNGYNFISLSQINCVYVIRIFQKSQTIEFGFCYLYKFITVLNFSNFS